MAARKEGWSSLEERQRLGRKGKGWRRMTERRLRERAVVDTVERALAGGFAPWRRGGLAGGVRCGGEGGQRPNNMFDISVIVRMLIWLSKCSSSINSFNFHEVSSLEYLIHVTTIHDQHSFFKPRLLISSPCQIIQILDIHMSNMKPFIGPHRQ